MLIKKVEPERILTLCDFPVHNEHILKMYFHMFRKGQGKIVPPCPVLPIDLWPQEAFGRTEKGKKLNEKFNKFRASHPELGYIVLDGTHKTTAAALAGSKILLAILRNQTDIQKMKDLAKTGEVFSFLGEDTIEASVKDLVKHFSQFGRFEAVAEKTARMVAKKVVPEYMIKAYQTKQYDKS